MQTCDGTSLLFTHFCQCILPTDGEEDVALQWSLVYLGGYVPHRSNHIYCIIYMYFKALYTLPTLLETLPTLLNLHHFNNI